MKTQELKNKLQKAAENMIDTYFSDNALIEKFANTTLKAMLKANMTKIDDFLSMFEDVNGDIDAESLFDSYAGDIENNFQIDVKKYIKSDFIKSLMPNKVLVITKDDILKIINDQTSNQNGQCVFKQNQQPLFIN